MLQAAADRVRSELEVELEPLSSEETEQLKMQAREEEEKRLAELDAGEEEQRDKLRSDVPTRLTVELDGDVYRFGAITETASVPERELSLDPDLVNDANNELAAQRERETRRVGGVSGEVADPGRLAATALVKRAVSAHL